jgi:hypothetical protein
MQLLHSEADGRHVCVLNDRELEALSLQVQCGPEDRLSAAADAMAWRIRFLRQLETLPLDDNTFNAIARAAKRQPDRFVDGGGERMSLDSWAQAVRTGAWQVPWVGPRRIKRILQALDIYLAAD